MDKIRGFEAGKSVEQEHDFTRPRPKTDAPDHPLP